MTFREAARVYPFTACFIGLTWLYLAAGALGLALGVADVWPAVALGAGVVQGVAVLAWLARP